MIEQLQISKGHWDMMRAHAAACAPLEACGLLAGRGTHVQEIIPITNAARSPVLFRMEPAEQVRAFEHIEESGQEMLGIFHSHPAYESATSRNASVPSPTDIEQAAYPVVHVIWSRGAGGWSALGYWIEDGQVSPLPLRITAGE